MGLMAGGKGGGKNALAAKPNLLSSLRVQTSTYGQVIPIVYGQNRISGRLLWSGDFAAIPHTSTQKVGGKGLGTGGGNAITNTTYTYQSAVATALCLGPIQNIHNVWDTKGKLTLLSTSIPFTVPPGGGSFLPPGGQIFHSGNGVGRADSFSLLINDFGSDGAGTLAGTQFTPMALVGSSPGAGQYVLNTATGQHTFSAADAGKTMTITYVYSEPDSNSNGQPQQKLNLTLFTGSRPQTPWSYLTSSHPGQNLGYNGVAYVASSAMDLGESGTLPNLSFEVLGILPFGGGITDCNPKDVISDLLSNPFYGLGTGFYQIQTSGGSTLFKYYLDFGLDTVGIQYQASITATNVGSVPISVSANHPGTVAIIQPGVTQNVAFTFTGTGAADLQIVFSAVNSVSDSITVLARDPVLCKVSDGINLVNTTQWTFTGWNVGPGATVIVTPQPQVPFGDLTQFSNYCVANGIFLSPVLDAQKAASEWIQEILDVTNSAAVWSEGILKIVPYGDTTAVANGAIYIPNTSPVYDLSNNDFLSPITVKRPSVADVMNSVTVEFLNRDNDYNVEIAEDKDDAMIALYGLRKDSPKQAHSITTTDVAKQVANCLRKREIEIRATYTITLGWQFNLLEPMDLITLTVPELGYSKKPVRITAIRENDNGQLELDAEDFPFGTASPTLYPQQSPGGFVPQANADPGNVNTPIVFEAPFLMSQSGQHEIWMAVSGASPNWGGCHVWVSQDNSDYQQIGHIFGSARMGVLAGTATSRTNLLTFSEQFDNAAWDKDGGSTISANNTLAPNGTAAADTFVKGSGTFVAWTHLEQHFSGNMSGHTWTFSIWMKVASGSLSGVALGLSDLTILSKFSSAVTVTTTWQRFSLSASGFNNTGSIAGGISVPGASGTHIQIWGAQLEQGAVVTPYIATTTSAVTVTSLINSAIDPDVTNYFPVDLTQSSGILQSGTQADADSYRTLCYVGGEFVAHQGVNLTAANQYNIGQDGAANVYLRRGLFGSNITSHAAGESFARLDNAVFTYVYDPSFIGKTIYLKFTSFNSNGLMEQSIANATAYQFIVTGKFMQMETVSKNLLANPGFEYNVASTPVSTYPNIFPVVSGQRFSDNWTSWNGTGFASIGDPYMTVDLESTTPRSGTQCAIVLNKPGAILPNDSHFYVQGVISDKVAVTPGESYCFGGWIRLVNDGSLPAGVSIWGVIRVMLYDASGGIIGQITYSEGQIAPGLGNGNPDAVLSGPLSGVVFSGGFYLQSTYFTVPTAFTGATNQNKPAFAAVCCTGILQNAGSSAWTMSGLQFDIRFDDCFLFPQWSPAGDEIGKQGSMSNTYTGNLTYTSNTSSITWNWNLNASRTDTALTVNNYTGSRAVTGLSAATSYNFYPFIDEVNQVVNMVGTGGVGSPSWAHSGTSVAWTQEQTRGDHFPLSSAPVVASTTSSGSGGGSGGGVGGACLRHDAVVREKSKGVIQVWDLSVGDWISCPQDEDTPEGWAEVTDVVKNHVSREWVHTFFNLDDWLATTPGHPFTLEDGSMKRAAQLCLEDAVPCTTGITYPVSHTLEIYSSTKVSVTIRSARHVFYAGMKSPCILQHNILPVS